MLLGRMGVAVPAIDAAMQHAYRMSERSQFLVRASYYGARNDAEKALAVLEMWSTVHPNDPMALRLLTMNYGITRDVPRALESIERLLELTPDDVGTLETIYGVAMHQIDRPDMAIRAAEHWSELTSGEIAPWVALADAQQEAGNLAAASEAIERALLLDPAAVDGRRIAAEIAMKQGDFDGAAATYTELMDAARPDSDRFDAIGGLMILENRRGRIDRAVELLAEWEELGRRVAPPGQFATLLSNRLDILVEDGRPDDARARIEELRAAMPDPIDGLLAMGATEIATESGDTATARIELALLAETVETLNVRVLHPEVHHLRARERLAAGDATAALAATDSVLALDPTLYGTGRYRARALLALDRIDDALEAIEWQLAADPSHPWALRDRGRILEAAGRRDDAMASYEAALEIWSTADPDYRVALETRRELEALRQKS